MGNMLILSPTVTMIDKEKFDIFKREWDALEPTLGKDGSVIFMWNDQDHIDPDELARDMATFASKGDVLEIQDIDAPENWSYEFDGSGGVCIKDEGSKQCRVLH
jgi:hypothetical protein